MGCLRSLGCLVMLVVLAAVGWMFRDSWRPFLHRGRAIIAGSPAPRATAPAPAPGDPWQALTPDGAARARAEVQRLGLKSGPVFANIRAGDLAAYVFQELSKQLPPSAENAEAAALGDELHVRATIRTSDLGGTSSLGPFAAMLGDREPVEFGGTLDIVRPGLAEYHVTTLRIRQLSIPKSMIPRLLRNIERGPRPAGIAADALPLVVPRYIADVRIHDGEVTLYKTTK